ncbi:MAG: LexA family protein [Candidatus Saccharimonadales bacterium]
MNGKQTAEKVRPTKKQQELLTFIDRFINEHGYSPSYREIMAGLNYTSVATVALHINNLIVRGHLVKRDRSARSLELAEPTGEHRLKTNQVAPAQEKWLIEKVGYFFDKAEAGTEPSDDELAQLQILLAALKVLGLNAASQSFSTRLAELKARS